MDYLSSAADCHGGGGFARHSAHPLPAAVPSGAGLRQHHPNRAEHRFAGFHDSVFRHWRHPGNHCAISLRPAAHRAQHLRGHPGGGSFGGGGGARVRLVRPANLAEGRTAAGPADHFRRTAHGHGDQHRGGYALRPDCGGRTGRVHLSGHRGEQYQHDSGRSRARLAAGHRAGHAARVVRERIAEQHVAADAGATSAPLLGSGAVGDRSGHGGLFLVLPR